MCNVCHQHGHVKDPNAWDLSGAKPFPREAQRNGESVNVDTVCRKCGYTVAFSPPQPLDVYDMKTAPRSLLLQRPAKPVSLFIPL